MMEADMMLTKPGRQLGLFTPVPKVQVRWPEKTTLKVKSLLAELLAGVWLKYPKRREGRRDYRGGGGE